MHFLKDNTIIICEKNTKISLLKKITNSFLNIKFYTKKEFLSEYYYKYDINAIYYLVKKYNYKIDVAKMYLDNLIYIDENKEYKSNKLKYLVELKKELDKEKLLIYNSSFINEIEGYSIVLLNYSYLEDFELELFNKLNALIYNEKGNNKIENIYVFDNMEEEINYVCYKISELLENNVDINKIKIMGVTDDYYNDLERIFKLYNINIKIPSFNYLISNSIANKFIENINSGLDNAIKVIEDEDEDIVNKIINICNKYADLDDGLIKYKLILNDLKNTSITNFKYKNYIDIISVNDYVDSDEYVFYLNFNNGVIPRVINDEDYINDSIKSYVGLKKVSVINKLEKEYEINKLRSINNLVITCKLKDNNGECYLSPLVQELKLKCIYPKIDITNSYSSSYDLIKYCQCIDDYRKYGTYTNDYFVYNNSITDNIYNSFNNKYTKINKKSLLDHLNNKLCLSYSSLNNYYKCAFKYYLTNILKLDKYEETFETFIGSVFHNVLEKCLNNNLNVDNEINNYIKSAKKELTIKERFYLEIIKEDIKKVIDIIREQNIFIGLDKVLYEKNIPIKITDNVLFMGVIDKIMYKDLDDKTIISIIDYKTGSVDINLNNIKDGINLQLPIYLYLTKKSNIFKKPLFAGFYIQYILNKDIKKKEDKTYNDQYKDNLKLIGYSNSSIHTLSLFDSSYKDSNLIQGLKIKKDGSFYGYSKVLNNAQIDNLINETEQVINNGVRNILDANFVINPKQIEFEEDVYGCKYCKFKDICFRKEEDIVTIKKGNLDYLGGEDNE